MILMKRVMGLHKRRSRSTSRPLPDIQENVEESAGKVAGSDSKERESAAALGGKKSLTQHPTSRYGTSTVVSGDDSIALTMM